MAKTQTTQTPHELHTFTFTMDKTALFNDAMATRWMKDNAEKMLLEKIDRMVASLRSAAEKIERDRSRINDGEWPTTAGRTAEQAIHEVNWMVANMDEDGILRQTSEWTSMCARAAAIDGTIQMAGLADEFAAKVAAYEASKQA